MASAGSLPQSPDPDPASALAASLTRRAFLERTTSTLGAAALLGWLAPGLGARAAPAWGAAPGVAAAPALAGSPARRPEGAPGAPVPPHFAPRAKRIVYLFQAEGPSQLDLFDWKPRLRELHGSELPDSVRGGQRLTGMTADQKSFPVVAPMFSFARHGERGAWVSELLPATARLVDQIALVHSVHTEAINHDPAITYILSGSQQPGRASFGSWLSWGLGSECADLPAYVVLISHGSSLRDAQPLFDRLWSAGFLPSNHQGVKLRGTGDPVLYLSDPPGVDAEGRRAVLDAQARLDGLRHAEVGDPEIAARVRQAEMAFRMQSSVPDLVDLADEPEETFALYGQDARVRGSYAANCLLARRLLERGVRCVQLFHRGWDQHENLPAEIRRQCRDTDRATAALVLDLERRGLLEDTLVVWGGEFGRTVYSQGELSATNHGRDHHGRCFTVWLAGAGIRRGIAYGETDDFGYNVVADPVHVHDLNATILHCLGLDHERLTFRHQGRDYRLTDVHGQVVTGLLA